MKVFFIILVILLMPCNVSADDIYSLWDTTSSQTLDNTAEISPDFSFDAAVRDMASGGGTFAVRDLMKNIMNFMLSEVMLSLRVLGRVIILGVLCGILSGLHIGKSAEGLKDVAFFVSYIVIAGIATTSFLEVAAAGGRVVGDMVLFTNAAVPAMGGLLVAAGSPSVFAALSPSLMLSAGAAGTLIKTVGLPAVYISLSLCLVSHINEKYSVRKLAMLIKNTAFWIVCAALTVFTAITGVVGFAAGTLDGITAKTAKFAASSAVPVLGGILSDSVEAVAGAAIILKNAAGAAGIIFIILGIIHPLIKIGAVILTYKLAAAVLQPVSDKRVIEALSDMGDVLAALMGMVAAAGVTMIVVLAMLINASNLGAMLR